MEQKPDWRHPIDTADQWDGFNDSGIETFSGSPIVNLAREVIQNALDAKHGEPVTVEFNLRERDVSDIPNAESFKKTINYCAESSEHEGKKAKAFLGKAQRALKKGQFSVLEISDFNTSGVKGPCEKGTPFYAFLKAKGQSNKPSRTSSGSYGIGKFAPYAVSAFRTVLVSTVYDDPKTGLNQLTQGKSILMSHDVDGDRRQGTGFWGNPDQCQPETGHPDIASWFLRSYESPLSAADIGTKICILGFEQKKNWAELLGISVAVNFFAALARGELEVKINDEIEVNQNTVGEMLRSEANKDIIRGSAIDRTAVEYCQSYLDALMSEDAFESDSQMRELGLTRLRLKVEEGLPRRIAIIRNGMFITDRLSGLKRFAGFKEFAGVLECKSDSGNELLRSIEPPRHDDFEPERAATEDEKKRAKNALDELAMWVRDMLSRHAKAEVADVTAVEELAEYFADDSETSSDTAGEDEDPLGGIVFSPRPIKRSPIRPKKGEEEVGGGDGEGDRDGGGGKDGQGGGDGAGGKGRGTGGESDSTSKGLSIPAENVRILGGTEKCRTIAFTPEQSARARLSVYLAGADRDEALTIKSASKGKVGAGRIELDVRAGQREVLEIECEREFKGALRVVLNEI